MRNKERKDIEDYIEQGVNKKTSENLIKSKTNWIAISLIVISLLTILILVSC